MSGSKGSGDDKRTKKELIAEIENLRRQLSSAEGGKVAAASKKPTLGSDMTRRDALKVAWVTPVVLSVPLMMSTGARSARALPPSPMSPTLSPTMRPTVSPTMRPTVSPTLRPTESPTMRPTVSPTMRPTVSPTMRPTRRPTPAPTDPGAGEPTAAPTAFPTVAVGAPLLSGGAAAVAAGALFGVAVKKLSDREKAAREDSEDSED